MSVIEQAGKIVEQLNRLFHKESSVNLLLVNDDYIYEGLVREALMNTFGYDAQKAYELMMSAHQNGSSVIWRGDKAKCEKYALDLRQVFGITTKIECE